MGKKFRIHIFGASGSGTSTLGKLLAQSIGAVCLDTDDYYWEDIDPPYTVKKPVTERLLLLNRDLEANKNWVLSGSLCSWGSSISPKFTLAILLRLDTESRIKRLKEREFKKFGSRIESGGDMEQNHKSFISWASMYDTAKSPVRSLDQHINWLATLSCPVLILDSSEYIENTCKDISMALHGG